MHVNRETLQNARTRGIDFGGWLFTAMASVAAAMLLLAVQRLPYGYYMVLRWIVFITSVLAVALLERRFRAFSSSRPIASDRKPHDAWEWILIGAAILFNPFWPIYLPAGTWAYVDVVLAGFFILSIFVVTGRARSVGFVRYVCEGSPQTPYIEPCRWFVLWNRRKGEFVSAEEAHRYLKIECLGSGDETAQRRVDLEGEVAIVYESEGGKFRLPADMVARLGDRSLWTLKDMFRDGCWVWEEICHPNDWPGTPGPEKWFWVCGVDRWSGHTFRVIGLGEEDAELKTREISIQEVLNEGGVDRRFIDSSRAVCRAVSFRAASRMDLDGCYKGFFCNAMRAEGYPDSPPNVDSVDSWIKDFLPVLSRKAKFYDSAVEKRMDGAGGDPHAAPKNQKKRVTVLLSYYLNSTFCELFRLLGYSTLWQDNPDDFEELVRTRDFDVAIEWQHGPRDFPVRDLIRKHGKRVPVLLSLNFNGQLPPDFDQLGYAGYLSTPFDTAGLDTIIRGVVHTDASG
ncbi:MAG: hypothetical protein JXQ75_10990 [Phycisphaerae bacterium]|nr:hypothetical protein [Phycisphaerae bacterium]